MSSNEAVCAEKIQCELQEAVCTENIHYELQCIVCCCVM